MNREKRLVKQKKYTTENQDKIKEYNKSIARRYSTYKKQAKQRNLIFQLSIEQFDKLTSTVCIYCGQFSPNKKFVGIDRIDNNKGYILSNAVSCCSICNIMKKNFTVIEFISHIKLISNNYNSNE